MERVWYRRVVDRRPPRDGNRILLHFTAVDYLADVWVNGIHVARHEGGSIGFSADVTDSLRADGEQSIVVRAVDSSTSLEQPRGKQDWEDVPHVIWYQRTTGIWREVWLEEVPASRIDRVSWQPLTASGRVRVDLRVIGAEPGDMAAIELTARRRPPVDVASLPCERPRVAATSSCTIARLDAEPERLQWSPDSPTLIDARVRPPA